MLFIASSWFAIFAVVVGWGHWMDLFWFRRVAPGVRLDLFRTFWLGLAALVVLLQWVSLGLRIDDPVFVGALLVGVFGIGHRCGLASAAVGQRSDNRARSWLIAAFVFVGLPLATLGAARLASVDVPLSFDANLYHLNWVRWTNEYPAVCGLGNLHSRLAHNTGHLLFAALLDNLWWDLRTLRILPAFFPLVLIAQWLTVLVRERSQRGPLFWYCLATLPYPIIELGRIVPGLDYDVSTHVLQLVGFGELVRHLVARANAEPRERPPVSAELVMALVAASLGFVFKTLGAALLAGTSLWIVFAAWQAAQRGTMGSTLRRCALIALLPAALLGGWLARNAVLSGWLLFPAPFGRLPVAWAMPAAPRREGDHLFEMQSVVGQYLVISNWARAPGAVEYVRSEHEGWRFWLRPWFERFRQTGAWWLFLTGAGVLALAAIFSSKWRGSTPAREGVWRGQIALVVLALACVAFWFFGAPDLRFGRVFFWILGAVSLASLFMVGKPPAMMRWLAVGMLLWITVLEFPQDWWPVLPVRLVSIPRVPMRQVDLIATPPPRWTVYSWYGPPVQGDTPLPCSPYYQGDLRLFRPDDLGSGFYLDLRERPRKN